MIENDKGMVISENSCGYRFDTEACKAIFLKGGNIFRTDDFFYEHEEEIVKHTEEMFEKMME